MINQIIQEVEAPFLRKNLPELNVGDTVKVFFKIKEGGKERTQGYEGVIIKRAGVGINQTITVRRVFQGVGIERVFLIHSPRVEKISVQRRGDVRRSKLYYLRARSGKATRIKEKMGAVKTSRMSAAQVSAQPEPAVQQAAPVESADVAPEAPVESSES